MRDWRTFLYQVLVIGPLQWAAVLVIQRVARGIEDQRLRDLALFLSPLLVVLAVVVIVWKAPWRGVAKKPRLRSFIAKKTIKVTDLVASDDPFIRGVTFEDCSFEGPAILILSGNTSLLEPQITLSTGEADVMLWEIPNSKRFVQGAVILENCVMRRCRFDKGIGIAAYPEQIALFKSQLEGR